MLRCSPSTVRAKPFSAPPSFWPAGLFIIGSSAAANRTNVCNISWNSRWRPQEKNSKNAKNSGPADRTRRALRQSSTHQNPHHRRCRGPRRHRRTPTTIGAPVPAAPRSPESSNVSARVPDFLKQVVDFSNTVHFSARPPDSPPQRNDRQLRFISEPVPVLTRQPRLLPACSGSHRQMR